jgi:hypothetical protein
VTAERGPMLAAVLWAAVMERAGWRCQCVGECGRAHRGKRDRGDGRCVAEHSDHARLAAAPAERVAAAAASRLTAQRLRAYCPRCHTGLTRQHSQAGDAAAPAADSLF